MPVPRHTRQVLDATHVFPVAIRVLVLLKAATIRVLTVVAREALVGAETLVGTHRAGVVGVVQQEEIGGVDPEDQRTLMARQGTSPIGEVMGAVAGGPTEVDREDLQAETRMIQTQGRVRGGCGASIGIPAICFMPMARASMRRKCRRTLPCVVPHNMGMARLVASEHRGVPCRRAAWRVVRWLGNCEDNNVSDEQLRNSEEFPRLDLMFAQELVRVAETSCAELAIRLKSPREARRSSHKVATGRQLYRF